jgi:hypothetical protein
MWPHGRSELLPQTNFYVKSLPIQDDYFEDLNEKFPEMGVDFEKFEELPEIEMHKIFNTQNNRVLFTMF